MSGPGLRALPAESTWLQATHHIYVVVIGLHTCVVKKINAHKTGWLTCAGRAAGVVAFGSTAAVGKNGLP